MVIISEPGYFSVGTSYEIHPPYPQLGHRVIYTSNSNPNIPFGRVGTVIGIYKENIEVFFDEPFIGASDLMGRCPNFRGALVHFYNIFNLSEWKDCVNTMEKVNHKLQLAMSGNFRQQNKRPIEEWDGQLNRMLLIGQMLKIRREADKKMKEPPKQKSKLKGKSEAFVSKPFTPTPVQSDHTSTRNNANGKLLLDELSSGPTQNQYPPLQASSSSSYQKRGHQVDKKSYNQGPNYSRNYEPKAKTKQYDDYRDKDYRGHKDNYRHSKKRHPRDDYYEEDYDEYLPVATTTKGGLSAEALEKTFTPAPSAGTISSPEALEAHLNAQNKDKEPLSGLDVTELEKGFQAQK